MGNFACSVPLSQNQIITVTESAITDPASAITDLNLVAQALAGILPDPGIALTDAINNALQAAQGQSITLFNETFPIEVFSTCFGAVVNYAPQPGNYDSLTNQIFTCLAYWNLLSPSIAALIAQPIQDSVINSSGVPTSTYGSVSAPVSGPVILEVTIYWTAAFGLFNTGGTNPDDSPGQGVVFGFSAANASQ